MLETLIGKICLNHQRIRGLVVKANYRMTVEIITPWKLDELEYNKWLERRGSPLREIDNTRNFRQIFYQSLSDRYVNLIHARTETDVVTDNLLYNEFFQNISVFIETIRAFGKPFDELKTIKPKDFPLEYENTLRNHIVHGYFAIRSGDSGEALITFIRRKKNNDTTRDKELRFGKLDFDLGYNSAKSTTLFYGNFELTFKVLELFIKLQEKIIICLNQCFIEDATPFSYYLSEGRFSHSELVESWNSFQRNLWVLKIITKPLGKVKSHFEKSINVQNSVLPTDLLTGIYEPEDVEFLDLDFD